MVQNSLGSYKLMTISMFGSPQFWIHKAFFWQIVPTNIMFQPKIFKNPTFLDLTQADRGRIDFEWWLLARN